MIMFTSLLFNYFAENEKNQHDKSDNRGEKVIGPEFTGNQSEDGDKNCRKIACAYKEKQVFKKVIK